MSMMCANGFCEIFLTFPRFLRVLNFTFFQCKLRHIVKLFYLHRVYGKRYEKKINKKKSSGVFCQEKPNKFMRFYYFNKDLLQQFHPEIHQKRIKTPGIKFFISPKPREKKNRKNFFMWRIFLCVWKFNAWKRARWIDDIHFMGAGREIKGGI